MKLNKKVLKELLEAPGISGREDKVYSIVKKHIKKNGLELETDNLGSIWGVKKSSNKNAKTMLIDAHMDEVGFLVTQISDNGFLSIVTVGGVWNQTLNTQRLNVWTEDHSKFYTGVTLWPGSNTHAKTGSAPKIEKMLVDIGATSKKEVEKWGIVVGSSVTFEGEAIFNGDRVITKAADNRVGVSMVLEIMDYIKDKEFDFNIVVGSSVQEENGLVGARTSSFMIEPDIAMVIDVSPANDFPAGEQPKGVLGAGTMLRHKDRATVYTQDTIQYLKSLMKKNDIKYQDYISLGGTNAGVIHLSREGVKTIPLGIVARSLHTASTVFDKRDYEETLKLIELILSDINSNKIVKFK